MKKNKKQVILAFILVFVLIVGSFIFGVWYFYQKEVTNRKSKDALVVKYSTDTITMKNNLPLTDALAKSMDDKSSEEGTLGYSRISLKNKSNVTINYEIYLTEQKNHINTLKNNYIKLYLTDINNKPKEGFDKNLLPSYKDLPVLTDKAESKLLYTGKIEGKSLDVLVLRSWVSDTYTLLDQSSSYTFDIDVRVK